MLIVLRHGQSLWNRDPEKPDLAWKYAGAVDVPLSAKGVQDALSAGATLKSLPIDVVYCSMLIRAQMTTLIALSTHNSGNAPLLVKDTEPTNVGARGLRAHHAKMSKGAHQTVLPVYCSNQLNERSFGDLQGVYEWEQKKLYSPLDLRTFRRDWRVAFPGGESQAQVYDRTVAFFERHIRPQLVKKKNVLLCCHGFVIKALVAHILDLQPREYAAEMDRDLAHDPKSLLASPNAVPRIFQFTPDAEDESKASFINRGNFVEISDRYPFHKAKL